MFGWRKKNFRFVLSEVNNINSDDIQDISDLVNFIGNENIDLQRRGATGSVVVTKIEEGRSCNQVIYSQKIELPIDCEPEEFEKILSKFHSKKPLTFDPIATEKKSYNFIPGKHEDSGYAAVPELNFEGKEIPEEVANTSEVEPQQENFSSEEAEEGSISEKDKKIKKQEEEITRLRAMANATPEPCEELIQKSAITEEIENKELSLEGKASVTLEAIELMNQAKRGMQPRDAIEYQVAVEYEVEKKRKLKETEEQAMIKQQSEISAAQQVFEEQKKEIVQKSEFELHKIKKTIDEEFEKRKMTEVNSRMDKQKEYIKNFVADMAYKMNKYIDSGKDINS